MTATLTGSRFDVETFLNTRSAGVQTVAQPPGTTLFSQATPADALFYVQRGLVRITVAAGKRPAVVLAILGSGDICGHECLATRTQHMSTATTMAPCTLIRIETGAMVHFLARHRIFAAWFVGYLLARNERLQEDLLDQRLHTSEQRLARALLLLSRIDARADEMTIIPKISQQTLAGLVGTTRSRVNYFMNRFRQKGFIDYDGGLHVHASLRSVTLQD